MTSHVPASCEVPRRKVTAKLTKIFQETIECAEKHKSAPRQMGWICRGARSLLCFGWVEVTGCFVDYSDTIYYQNDLDSGVQLSEGRK